MLWINGLSVSSFLGYGFSLLQVSGVKNQEVGGNWPLAENSARISEVKLQAFDIMLDDRKTPTNANLSSENAYSKLTFSSDNYKLQF